MTFRFLPFPDLRLDTFVHRPGDTALTRAINFAVIKIESEIFNKIPVVIKWNCKECIRFRVAGAGRRPLPSDRRRSLWRASCRANETAELLIQDFS